MHKLAKGPLCSNAYSEYSIKAKINSDTQNRKTPYAIESEDSIFQPIPLITILG